MIKEKSKTWRNFSLFVGKIFAKLPFSPDFYSWMTIPVAVIGFIFIANGKLLWGCFFFFLSGVLDIIDGSCARVRGKMTHRGAFLDGILDRFVDFIYVGSFFWLPMQFPVLSINLWIYMAGFGVMMPSFIVAYANHRQAVIDPEEKKIWRILNRGEIYFLILLIIVSAHWSSVLAGWLLIILVVLSGINILQSFILAMRLASADQSSD
ncbi:MAG: CDP-alcohol phosphatidyltransferase family protein [Pseudomonadota bacterium]